MGCKNTKPERGSHQITHRPPRDHIGVPSGTVPLPHTPEVERLENVLPHLFRVLATSDDAHQREYGVAVLRKGVAGHVSGLVPAQLHTLFKQVAQKMKDDKLTESVERFFAYTPISFQDAPVIMAINLWTGTGAAEVRPRADVESFMGTIWAKTKHAPNKAALDDLPQNVDFDAYLSLVVRYSLHYDMGQLFDRYRVGAVVPAQRLVNLFKDVQGESITLETAATLIRTVGYMNLENFISHFGSYTHNACISHSPPSDWGKHALHEYYVSSSYHTYLTGDQVRGSTNIEMFRYVLLEGCRCLEIECWDGGNGEPVVFHGCPDTDSIELRRVLFIVKENAFVATEHPVILSFDIYHLSPTQQKVLAQMLTDIFEGMLANGLMFDGNTHEIPLENMSKKILIKCKQLPIKPFVGIFVADMRRTGQGVKVTDVKAASAAARAGIQTDDWVTHVNGDAVQNVVDFKNRICKLGVGDNVVLRKENLADVSFVLGGVDDTTCTKIEVEDDDECPEVESIRQNSRTHSATVASELSHLVYLRPVSMMGWELKNPHEWEVASLSEDKFMKDIANDGLHDSIVGHNSQRCMRAYPSPLRTDSSNPSPIPFWAVGVQFVALNWQTKCEWMRLYRAFFAYLCEGAGYVLKPSYLRGQPGGQPGGSPSVSLGVDVLSAHDLPVDRKGAHVSVSVFTRGVGADDSFDEAAAIGPMVVTGCSTRVGLTFTREITCRDFAFLVVRLVEHREDREWFLAEGIVPLLGLRQGYRAMQLLDEEGQSLDHDATLFCRFQLTETGEQ
eukprot:PhM_4_TR5306/c1_g2_i1/m.25097